jgi:hypothetical protein
MVTHLNISESGISTLQNRPPSNDEIAYAIGFLHCAG